MRAVATSRASPALASQAENARSSMGAVEKLVALSCRLQSESATNRESIIPSKHSSAERRCVRWNAKPVRPSMKAAEKVKCTGDIRKLWT